MNQFRCESGTCIPITWVCDGQKDCNEGSDETQFCNFGNFSYCILSTQIKNISYNYFTNNYITLFLQNHCLLIVTQAIFSVTTVDVFMLSFSAMGQMIVRIIAMKQLDAMVLILRKPKNRLNI